MSETRFTPGPWRFEPRDLDPDDQPYEGRVRIGSADQNGENDKNGGFYIAHTFGPDRIVNAALISSAPELYEALKTARNQVVAFALRSIGADRAEAAVAYIDDALRRARGESGSAG